MPSMDGVNALALQKQSVSIFGHEFPFLDGYLSDFFLLFLLSVDQDIFKRQVGQARDFAEKIH